MLILLSPAKQLDFDHDGAALEPTQPRLMERTRELAETAKDLSARDLQLLMDISEDLAQLNRERFQAFDPDNAEGEPAALTFAGDVYRGLDAGSLGKDDLKWAQRRVRILSGLYGVLRPLDRIQPYRLEMGTRLKTDHGPSLYEFWDEDIAERLKADLDGHDHEVIVNLASQEYARAAKLKSIGAPVIECDFKEEKDGKLRTLMVYAKRARGLMARWIVEHRVEDPARLKDFDLEGYRYDAEGSTETKLLFTRPQPAKKS